MKNRPSACIFDPYRNMPIQYRSDTLLRSLAELHKQAAGLRGLTLITPDGLVIAAYPPGWDADIHDPTGGEHVAAMAAVVAGEAERILNRLDQGDLQQVLIEGERGTFAVMRVSREAALALLLSKDAKLGLILNAARQAAEGIRATLNPAS
jgi:predicted regulator of Ras-like GTPase activity (Roadblock/LC7/MglB family)